MDTIFKRYCDWVKAGVFERIFLVINEDCDMEYAVIDGTIVKVHRHGQGDLLSVYRKIWRRYDD